MGEWECLSRDHATVENLELLVYFETGLVEEITYERRQVANRINPASNRQDHGLVDVWEPGLKQPIRDFVHYIHLGRGIPGFALFLNQMTASSKGALKSNCGVVHRQMGPTGTYNAARMMRIGLCGQRMLREEFVFLVISVFNTYPATWPVPPSLPPLLRGNAPVSKIVSCRFLSSTETRTRD